MIQKLSTYNVTIHRKVFLLCLGLLLFINCMDVHSLNADDKPKITIITSLYKGDQFIQGFLEDIIQQTIFNQCELLIINANSPGNESPVIEHYCTMCPNIRYIRLNYDPGLYGVWNIGIKIARGTYLTNANVDDRLAHTCYQEHAQLLDNEPDIDLVYSDHYVSYIPNETFNQCAKNNNEIWYYPDFSRINSLRQSLPNNHPMWRASMHKKCGYFDEQFVSAGDWDLWIKAVLNGSIHKCIHKPLAVFYINPKGLSQQKNHIKEVYAITRKYGLTTKKKTS